MSKGAVDDSGSVLDVSQVRGCVWRPGQTRYVEPTEKRYERAVTQYEDMVHTSRSLDV
jgi:hypothetical protein